MNIERLIQQYCASEKSLESYITFRLQGDTNQAPPNLSSYQGMDSIEDILILIYQHVSFSEQQKQWFWNITNMIAMKAWEQEDPSLLNSIVYIWIDFGYEEAEKYAWVDFFPEKQTGFSWSNNIGEAKISLYSTVLWLMTTWQIRDDFFWKNQFEVIIRLLPKAPSLKNPLGRVINALGMLSYPQWGMMFYAGGCNNEDLQAFITQCFVSQWVACQKNFAQEQIFIIHIDQAGRSLYETPQNKDVQDNFKRMLCSWEKLPWSKDLKSSLSSLIILFKKDINPISPMVRIQMAA